MANYLEENCNKSELKKIAIKDASCDRGKFNQYADPLLYGKYIKQPIGKKKTYFSLNKPLASGLVQKDLWFHQLADSETKKQFDIWLAGINLLQSKIDKKYFNKGENIFKTNNTTEFQKKYEKTQKEYHLHHMIDKPNTHNDRHIILARLAVGVLFILLENQSLI